MLKGSATSEGTAAYRAAQGAGTANGHFREWRGLSISSLGIGTYLGPDDDTTDTLYEAAVERAIVSGINVVDSAINYRGQRSERAVGRALGRLVGARGGRGRDQGRLPSFRRARAAGAAAIRRCRGRKPLHDAALSGGPDRAQPRQPRRRDHRHLLFAQSRDPAGRGVAAGLHAPSPGGLRVP